MKKMQYAAFKMIGSFLVFLAILSAAIPARNKAFAASAYTNGDTGELRDKEAVLVKFLSLADIAAEAVGNEPVTAEKSESESRLRAYNQHFVDSYAVRALAVAYDLTGRERYWRACKAWSDRMLRYQSGMIPKGAYYMDYHRKPGESTGQWFVAD